MEAPLLAQIVSEVGNLCEDTSECHWTLTWLNTYLCAQQDAIRRRILYGETISHSHGIRMPDCPVKLTGSRLEGQKEVFLHTTCS